LHCTIGLRGEIVVEVVKLARDTTRFKRASHEALHIVTRNRTPE